MMDSPASLERRTDDEVRRGLSNANAVVDPSRRGEARPSPDVSTVKTTCPYCGVGCGVLADVAETGAVSVRGDPDHPANAGRLCSKGSALAETLSLDDRLLHPEVDGERATWDVALDHVARRFSQTIADHGPDAVAFYVSGQLLTEDYYVANKLMKGFIGSGNIDTNSRLCMASSVAGHKRAFGADTVPGTYADLEEADLVVLVGSNFAWCHPVLFQRMMAARETRGMRLVVIDPRRTPTAEQADLHLPIEADGDVALFNGLLRHLAGAAADSDYVEAHTTGLAEALAAATGLDAPAVARATGLASADIATFYDLFAATERVVTVFSQGVNQSVCGTDKVNAIINCHLVTGRIGRPGMGPFSITGQPNAMGGREVGGLANQLAAHLDIDDPAHRDLVRGFWNAPRMATRGGLKAVDLFRAVADGRVKALWIIATNPVDSMPEADGVRDALACCPFVVCSDVIRDTDTTRLAHVLLPAAAWGEKDGTVTNSERCITRQRPFMAPPGDAKPDWWIVDQVASRMGFGAGFGFADAAEIFKEHASLSTVGNAGTRDFDIGGLADLDRDDYERMAPVHWPIRAGETSGTRRFFADGQFFTPNRRARFIPTHVPKPRAIDPAYPLTLNTGRIRDQWHTMTRTGKSPRLSAHLLEPAVTLHPDDAREAGILHGTLAICESASGRIVGRAQISDDQTRGSVFVPMHWTDQFASAARVDALISGHTDPVSGQPASKMARARVRPFPARWYGFAVTRQKLNGAGQDYWVSARVADGWQTELAGLEAIADWPTVAAVLLGATEAGARLITYDDPRSGHYRMAVLRAGRLDAVLFVAPRPVAVARAFVASALTDALSEAEAFRLLAGRPGAGRIDRGATICSCFQVGINQIRTAITVGGCATVAEVGAALKAGTNCGSCRPEIQRIITGALPRA
ncbi:nitrate reductase [Lichenihabitans psoromatis]|uniref:nitrate reductase n=1 Tax=Lichenihabitans psoromatis TaxID=2528642 RepID=UPI001FDF3F0E|nr:nitrate reductase [Lichenihabitans psoromatis]